MYRRRDQSTDADTEEALEEQNLCVPTCLACIGSMEANEQLSGWKQVSSGLVSQSNHPCKLISIRAREASDMNMGRLPSGKWSAWTRWAP